MAKYNVWVTYSDVVEADTEWEAKQIALSEVEVYIRAELIEEEESDV